MPFPGFPVVAKLGQSLVYDGLQWALQQVAVLAYANVFTQPQTINTSAGTPALRLGPDVNSALGLTAALTIDATGGLPAVFADFRAGSNGPAPIFYKARGLTAAGRTATQSTDNLLFLLGSGRGSTIDHFNKGGFYISAATSWSDTNADTQIDFLTTPTGSISRIIRMTIAQDGNIGIGVAPTASNGLIQLASGTTQANGWAMGTDVHGFRNAANAFTLDATAGFTTNGGRTRKTRSVVTAAGTTTLDASDDRVFFTGTTTQNCTLPAATSGRGLFISNASTGTVTVNRAGSDTIMTPATSYSLTAGSSIYFEANGTDWRLG